MLDILKPFDPLASHSLAPFTPSTLLLILKNVYTYTPSFFIHGFILPDFE